MNIFKEIWDHLVKKKTIYNKIIVEVDPSINYLMAREIIRGLNSSILIDKMHVCDSLESLDTCRDVYIAESCRISFFEYKYWLTKFVSRLQDAHLDKYIRIPFKVKIYNNPEEEDLDKYDHVFIVELDRAYRDQDWHVLKCDFA